MQLRATDGKDASCEIIGRDIVCGSSVFDLDELQGTDGADGVDGVDGSDGTNAVIFRTGSYPNLWTLL